MPIRISISMLAMALTVLIMVAQSAQTTTDALMNEIQTNFARRNDISTSDAPTNGAATSDSPTSDSPKNDPMKYDTQKHDAPMNVPTSDTPMSVVLITSDTTRSQSLACYGEPLGRMPNLDRLVKSGTLFRWHYSVATATLPAHASMLTGQFPDRCDVKTNESRLPSSTVTLAKILQEHGYDTASFVSVNILKTLQRDFARAELPPHDRVWCRSSAHLAAITSYLRSRKDNPQPFFLWVHSFDPHHPYAPPRPFRKMFTEVAHGQPFYDYERDPRVPVGYYPEFPRDSTLAQYYGALRYWDSNLGKIMNEVSRLENVLVIFVADHGENLGEGGQFGHHWVTEQVLKTPLTFWHSDKAVVPAARVVNGVAQQVDIMPTVLSMLGLPVSEDQLIEGTDLTPFIRGAAPPARHAYSMGLCVAAMTDPERGVKVRRRLIGERVSAEVPDQFPQFTDTILESGCVINKQEFFEYKGSCVIPEAKYMQIVETGLSVANTWISMSELKIKPNGEFSHRYELTEPLAGDNFYMLYGERCPFQDSSIGSLAYAVRFCDKYHKSLWESPWIYWRFSNSQRPAREYWERVVQTDQPHEVELGTEYLFCVNPATDRLEQELERMFARPGTVPALEVLSDGVISLRGLRQLTPDQAFEYARRPAAPAAEKHDEMEEALRSLGYLSHH